MRRKGLVFAVVVCLLCCWGVAQAGQHGEVKIDLTEKGAVPGDGYSRVFIDGKYDAVGGENIMEGWGDVYHSGDLYSVDSGGTKIEGSYGQMSGKVNFNTPGATSMSVFADCEAVTDHLYSIETGDKDVSAHAKSMVNAEYSNGNDRVGVFEAAGNSNSNIFVSADGNWVCAETKSFGNYSNTGGTANYSNTGIAEAGMAVTNGSGIVSASGSSGYNAPPGSSGMARTEASAIQTITENGRSAYAMVKSSSSVKKGGNP